MLFFVWVIPSYKESSSNFHALYISIYSLTDFLDTCTQSNRKTASFSTANWRPVNLADILPLGTYIHQKMTCHISMPFPKNFFRTDCYSQHQNSHQLLIHNFLIRNNLISVLCDKNLYLPLC